MPHTHAYDKIQVRSHLMMHFSSWQPIKIADNHALSKVHRKKSSLYDLYDLLKTDLIVTWI